MNLNSVIIKYDGKNLYSSEMWDEITVCAKIESGYVFKPYMNDTLVGEFNNQTFNQDGNGSAILKLKFYNEPGLIFQDLAVKVIAKKTDKPIWEKIKKRFFDKRWCSGNC